MNRPTMTSPMSAMRAREFSRHSGDFLRIAKDLRTEMIESEDTTRDCRWSAGAGRSMIKATIRVTPGRAANDEAKVSGRPAVMHLGAFRAGATRSPDDDARALLERVAEGDQPAFETLYRLLSRRVHAFALRITGNVQSAEEVTVDTLHEVWRSAARFRRDAMVSTWVLGIARKKALMTLRSRPSAEHVEIGDLAETLDSGLPDGFALLAQARNAEMIRRCLQELSVEHRECLHLAFYDELPVHEIASVLGIPEGTVKSRLWHARARLAARISAISGRQPRPV